MAVFAKRGVTLRNWDIFLTFGLALAMAVATLTPLPNLAPVPGSDKLHHVLAFAALSVPLSITRPNAWVWVALLAVLYGGAIELIQPHIGRSGEWADFWADCSGVVIGMGLGRAIGRMRS